MVNEIKRLMNMLEEFEKNSASESEAEQKERMAKL